MDSSGCATGAFVNGLENLSNFQQKIGKNLAVVLIYIHWTEPFPKTEADIIYENGSMPLLTWEPWVSGGLDSISAGEYEKYVYDFMRAAKAWGKPLFLRFAHEMNGNWYPWDGQHNNSSPERYKKAWLYIYSVRKELGADNIRLVWCVNNVNQPDVSWNVPSAYYPGDQYVDWIGMDGYNWGYGAWQSFDALFGEVYKELTSLTQKPLMIGEFASAEDKEKKGEWIRQSFSDFKKKYPRIKIFCWFNINKERDWRIDSSPQAASAFAAEISDTHFVEKML